MKIDFLDQLLKLEINNINWIISYLNKKEIPIRKGNILTLKPEKLRRHINEEVSFFCSTDNEVNELIKDIRNAWSSKIYRDKQSKIRKCHLNVQVNQTSMNKLRKICQKEGATQSDIVERIIQDSYKQYSWVRKTQVNRDNQLLLDLDLLRTMRDMINDKDKELEKAKHYIRELERQQ
jgi:hypothetical protein